MKTALHLAQRGLGDVWPNPAVGCVIVDGAGHIVGRGWTQRGGRPHAETEALAPAGAAARGATAYVTLEPCAHQGVTGPCASALDRCGRRARRLSAAKIPIRASAARVTQCYAPPASRSSPASREKEARAVECGLLQPCPARPAVRHSETCDDARRQDRALERRKPLDHERTRTPRRASLARAPRRRDGRHRHCARRRSGVDVSSAGHSARPRWCALSPTPTRGSPPASKLASTAQSEIAVWLLCAADADGSRQAALSKTGVRVFHVPRTPDGIDLARAFDGARTSEGLTRVFVEGGATLAAGAAQGATWLIDLLGSRRLRQSAAMA